MRCHLLQNTYQGTDSRKKLTSKALSALGAVFLAEDVLNELDHEVFKSNTTDRPEEVAKQWIEDNQKTFDMFFWR